MPALNFQPTPEQRAAIHAADGSVLVSAAAGSGKTAVLAERCAYLVCDAPQGRRCDVDQLLVLTFTEAAAAEMRGRIIDCIRARLEADPADGRLREQMALAGAAQISTIHSFCLWLIRRWFSEAKVDAAATVMDAEEASLLRREVLERILNGLYAPSAKADDPLGVAALSAQNDPRGAWKADDWKLGQRDQAALGQAFVQLVDVYGLGSDGEIIGFVLRLYDFTTSLPDWREWLTQAVQVPASRPQEAIERLCDELRRELEQQIAHVAAGVQRLGRSGAAGVFGEYLEHLRVWLATLDQAAAPGAKGATYEAVREMIRLYELPKRPSSGKARGSDGPDEDALFKTTKKGNERLWSRFSLFSVEEWLDGLRQTAPFIAAVCDLVAALHEAYGAEKRRLGLIDFADLERLAFELLVEAEPGDGDSVGARPSPIASALHDKFAYVLVDESQDINPLQEAILRMTSREAAPDMADNLFAVGDIKQSIYRFRLAEPSIFAHRLNRFRRSSAPAAASSKGEGSALFLQRNFRSRPELLEAVNLVFGTLMNGAGGIAYDEQAMLRPGRMLDTPSRPEPIEVHVVERTMTQADAELDDEDEGKENGGADEPGEPRVADYANPANWTPIEREAYLIGQRIRELTAATREGSASTIRRGNAGGDISPPPQGVGHPTWEYRDIAILLRATKVNAERMAAMLSAMGIPAHAEVGGSLFAAREVRDVIAALQVLDNVQQDISLAAVLRSGIFGDRLTPDELVEVRLLDLRAPFHEVVRRYAGRPSPEDRDVAAPTPPERGRGEGGDSRNADLRGRLADLLAAIERYRQRARRRPLSETLWAIYEDEGFLAHCAGLPNGPQRRANLIKLHDLARKFDTFRLQGLHRFLKFLASLEDEKREVDVAPAVGEADNVVRIMSVHQSKGLEFPVVFVAGLGNAFNLGDRRGRMVFERASRIGLKVVDTRRMIDYPSAGHRLATLEIERTSREEEMRILYVAMTRAKDKLVLVGSRHDADVLGTLGTPRYAGGGSSPYSIASANSPLDWLLPLLHDLPDKLHVQASPDAAKASPAAARETVFTLTIHRQPEIQTWRALEPATAAQQRTRQAVAELGPLPPDEPISPRDEEVQQTLERLSFTYPHLATTSVKATLSASDYGAATEQNAGDFRESFGRHFRPFEFAAPPSKYAPLPADEPTRRGTLTHRVLQHVDFEKATDAAGVASELQSMVLRGLLTAEECAVVDQAALTWFVGTPLAARIREAGGQYRRELRFVTGVPVRSIDPSTAALDEDRVLVRGVVDGIIAGSTEVEVIDFKTDAVNTAEIETLAAHYQSQIDVYAGAASRLWTRPVRSCHLVFLTPRRIVTREFAPRESQTQAAAMGQQMFPWMSR